MNPAMKFLRRILFLPHGNPDKQQQDINEVHKALLSGREQVRRALRNAELANSLNTLANETLAKLEDT